MCPGHVVLTQVIHPQVAATTDTLDTVDTLNHHPAVTLDGDIQFAPGDIDGSRAIVDPGAVQVRIGAALGLLAGQL